MSAVTTFQATPVHVVITAFPAVTQLKILIGGMMNLVRKISRVADYYRYPQEAHSHLKRDFHRQPYEETAS